MNDWDELVCFACSLPGVTIESFYRNLVPKHRGKALVSPGHEPGSFCLMVTMAEKQMLIETDPETFWETDHYRGYPAVLVRYGRARDRIETYVTRRWWDVASKADRTAFGARP